MALATTEEEQSPQVPFDFANRFDYHFRHVNEIQTANPRAKALCHLLCCGSCESNSH